MGNNKVGEKIAKLRKKNNLTQIELGKELNVSDKTISKWENNNSEPDIEMINKISKYFNIKPSSLIDEIPKYNKFKNFFNVTVKFMRKNWINFILLIIFLILISYFVNNFNRIKMYEIKVEGVGINIENGYFLATKDVNILSLNNISIESSEDAVSQKLKLYTTVNNDKTYFYESEEIDDIFIEDYYNEVLTNNITKNIPIHLILEVETLTKNEKVVTKQYKLGLINIVNSNEFFYHKKAKYASEAISMNIVKKIEPAILLKNGYARVDKSEIYYKDFKDYRIYFDLTVEKMTYKSNNTKVELEIDYNYNKGILEYKNINTKIDNIIQFRYYITNNELNCVEGNCDNYQEILEDILDLFYKQIQ